MANADIGAFRPIPARGTGIQRGPASPLIVFAAPFLMVLTLILAVFTHSAAISWASMGFLFLIIGFYSFTNPAEALMWFMVYSAMEGYFKYSNNFAQASYLGKPILLLIILAGWWAGAKQIGRRVILPIIMVEMVMLIGWGLAEIYNPYGRSFTAGMSALLVWYVLPMIVFVVAYDSIRTPAQTEKLIYVLLGISIVVSLFAIIQFGLGRAWCDSNIPGYSNLARLEWFVKSESGETIASSFRPASTAPQGGAGALWSGLGLALCVGLLTSSKRGVMQWVVLLSCIGINFVGIMVSGVRMVLLLAIIDTVLLAVLSTKTSKAMRTLGTLVCGSLVVYAGFVGAQGLSGGSLSQRYEQTLANPVQRFQTDRGANLLYLPQFIVKWPIGVGYQRGTEGGVQHAASGTIEVSRETQFNAIAADMGIPGLILVIAITVRILWLAWRLTRSTNPSALQIVFFVVFIGLVISYLAGPTMQFTDYFWLVAALAIQRGVGKVGAAAEPLESPG